MSDKIKSHHVERKAILYVRQSSAYRSVEARREKAKPHDQVKGRRPRYTMLTLRRRVCVRQNRAFDTV